MLTLNRLEQEIGKVACSTSFLEYVKVLVFTRNITMMKIICSTFPKLNNVLTNSIYENVLNLSFQEFRTTYLTKEVSITLVPCFHISAVTKTYFEFYLYLYQIQK